MSLESAANQIPSHVMIGSIFGTNTGNIFLEFSVDEASQELNGLLRINDASSGIVSFEVRGEFHSNKFQLVGKKFGEPENNEADNENDAEQFVANLELGQDGTYAGRWVSRGGNAGTLHLMPQNTNQNRAGGQQSKRLNVATTSTYSERRCN